MAYSGRGDDAAFYISVSVFVSLFLFLILFLFHIVEKRK